MQQPLKCVPTNTLMTKSELRVNLKKKKKKKEKMQLCAAWQYLDHSDFFCSSLRLLVCYGQRKGGRWNH